MHQPLSIDDIAEVIADSVSRETSVLSDTLAALAKSVAGLRADLAALAAERDQERESEAERFRSAAIAVLIGEAETTIRSAVQDAVAALPTPEPGRDADPQVVAGLLAPVVAELVSRSGDDIEARLRSAIEPPDIRGLVDAAVRDAIAALPEPAPGRDASAAEVAEVLAPLVADTVRSAVEAFRPDWSGVADIVRAAASAEPPPTPATVKQWVADDLVVIADTIRQSIMDGLPAEVGKAVEAEVGRRMAEGTGEAVAIDIDAIRSEVLAAVERSVPDMVAERVRQAVDAIEIPAGPAGKDADPSAVADILLPQLIESVGPMIGSEVEKRVAELPPPPAGAPGRDADPAEVAEIARGMIRESLPDLISRAVGTAIAELPPDAFPAGPQGPEGPAGKDIGVEDLMPTIDRLIRNAVTEPLAAAVEAVKSAAVPGQDGVSIKDAAIGQAGDLVLTLSDGTILKPGIVVGRSVSDEDVRQMVADAAAALPRARDGFGFDDLSADFDGDRTVTLRFVRGEDEKAFAIPLPIPVYRGVWKAGTFRRGDTVTFGGNLWIAKQDTEGRPGGDATWQLAVKRGRDGQDTVRVPRDPNKPVSVKP